MKKALILSLVLAAVLTGCSVINDESADDSVNPVPAASPVALVYASALQYFWSNATYPYYKGYAQGYIEVSNIAYTKQVVVRYMEKESGVWADVNATYVKSISGNKEIWTFKTPEKIFVGRWSSAEYQFAVKYTVNGVTYWDNNDGKDYKVGTGTYSASPAMVLGRSAVQLKTASYSSLSTTKGLLSGMIVLKNLAYTKTVQVQFSTNNWKSSFTRNAVYGGAYVASGPNGGTATGLEYWNFSATNALPAGKNLKIRVKYTVNGVTYTDNNFGSDYSLALNGSIER